MQQNVANTATDAQLAQQTEEAGDAEPMQIDSHNDHQPLGDLVEGPQPPKAHETSMGGDIANAPGHEPKQREVEAATGERPLESPRGFDSLPPELEAPPGECDPEVQSRVARWLDLQKQHGRRLTDTLRASRDYRNPEFFRKMVEYWEINEHGTVFPPETFDPGALPEEDTIDSLKKEWAVEEERRRAARAAGTSRIDFVRSGPPPAVHPSSGTGIATAAAVAAAQAKAAALAAGFSRR